MLRQGSCGLATVEPDGSTGQGGGGSGGLAGRLVQEPLTATTLSTRGDGRGERAVWPWVVAGLAESWPGTQ